MRNLLVFSYYFPPSGGPGVQRTLRTVAHLPRLGWEPAVVTVRPEDAAWPALDPSLSREVPPDIDVRRTRALDPYTAYARMTGRARGDAVSVGFADVDGASPGERAARWVRANVFLPDARVGWVPHALREGRRLVAGRPFHAIWSTGPPHSTHLAARSLARSSRLPWVADFRDAWPDPTYAHRLPTGRWAAAVDGWLRRRVLSRADAVVAVGERLADELRRMTSTPVRVIGNGFETGDFDRAPREPHEGFELLHAGNMPAERDPTALWTALARLGGDVPELRVRLVGPVDPSIRASAARHGCEGWLRVEAAVPHDRAVAAMVSADALLLSINRTAGADGILTGKLYEYVASGRPVVGVGPCGGEVDGLLRDTGAGRMFDFDDADGLARRIRALYDAWAAGRPERGASAEAAAPLARFERTRELAALLDELVGEPARSTS